MVCDQYRNACKMRDIYTIKWCLWWFMQDIKVATLQKKYITQHKCIVQVWWQVYTYLCCGILGGRNEHRHVPGELEVIDLLTVFFTAVDFVPRFEVIMTNLSIFVTSDDVLFIRPPHCWRDLTAGNWNHHRRLTISWNKHTNALSTAPETFKDMRFII